MKEYWIKSKDLVNELTTFDKFIVVEHAFKLKILAKIKGIIGNKSGYLVSILIIRGKVDVDCLMNFLLYLSINDDRYYESFLTNPDAFGKTLMFNIHPSQLPKLKNILTDVEYKDFLNKINSSEIIENLSSVKRPRLEKEFPRTSSHHGLMNSYYRESIHYL